MSDVVIWHNPRCGTSRKVLDLLRAEGIEPAIVLYLQTPPDQATLADVIARAGLSVREAIRSKEAAYGERGLDDPGLDDAALLDAMVADPVLINRPFVMTPQGVRLCRPAERVREIL
ncbi:arsenate reductase (glutaredoxin) [Gluconacetobacter azotocaptans]|uniref:Arsenate reductase n=1 Tax=Gluconacetobacter azotocaptans TaxID=142834 RepID=A0A7W4JRQ0_9PROT|nr:arsenate reductase (glutaredoxin) [Gluconacetobacter azotocaptans]MBB2189648.1 arsenate reductase (glutaredoxin) [Gluconacetobacter azotocaptans]GBQ29338.1 arsenate reductase [Gluconacetobacter azotocaptans DSM 13594]